MFTVIYRNNPEVRNQVIALLTQVVQQGHDLNTAVINHPLCSVRSSRPSMQELMNLPLHIQCEEMEYVEGQFKTVRLQVVDVEALVIKKEAVTSPLTTDQV